MRASSRATSKVTLDCPLIRDCKLAILSAPPEILFCFQISSTATINSIHSWGLPSLKILTDFLYFVEFSQKPALDFRENSRYLDLSFSSCTKSLPGINGSMGKQPGLLAGVRLIF